MRNSVGASVPDQALAVPVEPVSRLDPAGFDPSRGSGWIAWRGGPMPVASDSLVDVMWNNRAISRNTAAGAFGPSAYAPDLWASANPTCCIIAYRLARSPEESFVLRRAIEDAFREGWVSGYSAGRIGGVIDPTPDWRESAASGTLTEGGDAKQAPGDSLSGPTAESGDAHPSV